jgi:hypothetical protein
MAGGYWQVQPSGKLLRGINNPPAKQLINEPISAGNPPESIKYIRTTAILSELIDNL